MGSDDERDLWLLKASPQHKVTLPAYYMARYPVTVAQFRPCGRKRLCMGRQKSSAGSCESSCRYVSWHDALAYCKWLTARLREWSDTPEPLATLLRTEDWRVILPSEAEWEKAARGIDGRLIPGATSLIRIGRTTMKQALIQQARDAFRTVPAPMVWKN